MASYSQHQSRKWWKKLLLVNLSEYNHSQQSLFHGWGSTEHQSAHMLVFWSKVGGGRASITGICLKPWDVLRPWQRAPNLNACYTDMVKHMPMLTRKSQGPGSRVSRACRNMPLWLRDRCRLSQKCWCPFKTINKIWRKKETDSHCIPAFPSLSSGPW